MFSARSLSFISWEAARKSFRKATLRLFGKIVELLNPLHFVALVESLNPAHTHGKAPAREGGFLSHAVFA